MTDLETKYPIIENWDDYNDLHTELLRGIYSYGFEKPSPIQQQGILPIIKKHDLIAQAQSGTGKTGCFSIGTLQLLDLNNKNVQAIIISPTRELASQIFSVITEIGKQMSGFNAKLLIGGTSINSDLNDFKENNYQCVVGTPGRIYDLINRRVINTNEMKILVIDEADEMLSQGFKQQIYNIFQYMPESLQIALFSATLPNEVEELTKKFMRDPIKILVKQNMLTLEGISQFYVALEDDETKYLTLKDLYTKISISQCIIYCNTNKRVDVLYNNMINDDFPVCKIHSNMDKQERTDNYNEFKNGKYRVLISSNLTARGIDIQQVSTVINYDIPKDVHIYLHRIGRSGRWGRKGSALNFVTKFDFYLLKEIEKYYHTQINELPQSFNEV